MNGSSSSSSGKGPMQAWQYANTVLIEPFRLLNVCRSHSSSRLTSSFLSPIQQHRSQSEQYLYRTHASSRQPTLNTAKQVQSHHSQCSIVSGVTLAQLKCRRNVMISKRHDGKYGFTVQSYLFERSANGTRERTTYVDHVVIDSPAFEAGLRTGDVILSVNGTDVYDFTHQQLIDKINSSKSLHMAVVFSNNVEKIEMYSRCIKLLNLLADKQFELSVLEKQEQRLRRKMPPLTGEQMLRLVRRDFMESTESINLPPVFNDRARPSRLDANALSSCSMPLVNRQAVDDFVYLPISCDRIPMTPVIRRSASDLPMHQRKLANGQQESTRL